jgi:hypothetical protein
MAGHILGNGMIAFLVLRYQHGARTKNYITILFKKIKYFLIIGTLSNILFCVFTGSDQQLSEKRS